MDVALTIIRPVVSLWPISGQQPIYFTQKYQFSSLGTSTEVRLKKYQVPHFGDQNAKKGQVLIRTHSDALSAVPPSVFVIMVTVVTVVASVRFIPWKEKKGILQITLLLFHSLTGCVEFLAPVIDKQNASTRPITEEI